MFIGDGIVVAEGEDHKRQRKIMNPAFGPIPIREMCKTFVEKAKEVKEGIENLFDHDDMNQLGEKEGDIKGRDYVETDMVSWISRAALDIIGLTGFNYSFNSVKSHSKKTQSSLSDDELYTALEEIFVATQLGFHLLFLKTWIPWLRLWTWDKTTKKFRRSHAIMNRIGKKLVDEKMQAIKEGIVDGQEKDLLTLLIKANLQEEEGKKMTEKEVLNQIPTFLIAGEFSQRIHRTRLTFPSTST
jgi:cytochrome P450